MAAFKEWFRRLFSARSSDDSDEMEDDESEMQKPTAPKPLVLSPEEQSKLPLFRYHPDPLSTGAVKQEKITCPVCKRTRAYYYDGPFYSEEEIEKICPWCIKDGTAAYKFDGCFVDIPSESEKCDRLKLEELCYRTPSYTAWQQADWPTHCNDFCAFIAYVGWKELEERDLLEELEPDINRLIEEYGTSREQFAGWLRNDGDMQGYLFRCLHCRKHRLFCDGN